MFHDMKRRRAVRAALAIISTATIALLTTSQQPGAILLHRRSKFRSASLLTTSKLLRLSRTACLSQKRLYPSVPNDEFVLVDKDLKQLIDQDCFDFDIGPEARVRSPLVSPPLLDYVQPATIDIPISGPVHLLKERVLPFRQNLSNLLPALTLQQWDFGDNEEGVLLLKGQSYLIRCGKVTLPSGCRGVLSPKSSIGRIDVMVRSVVDGCGLYDVIPEYTAATADGVQGSQCAELWVEVTPRSFNVRIYRGLALTQLMILSSSKNGFDMNNDDNEEEKGKGEVSRSDGAMPPLLYGDDEKEIPLNLHNGMIILGIRVPRTHGEIIGYEAISTSDVVDLKRVSGHSHEDFFRPISYYGSENGGRLVLEKDRFYILCIKERVAVPKEFSAEMIPFSHNIGELRAHYAGFFDPGFGIDEHGGLRGSNGVLEVRPHETVTIYDGQPICLMQFFRNRCVPEKPYGTTALGSHYQGQTGPWLAKYFAKPKETSSVE
eukprot:jgi/Bigna1/88578/estExt_fgenesh1_pg.C_340058